MDIIISCNTGKPIYEQITDQVKEQIMTGALAAGDALPSMRLLAKELRISVITTKRAYEELERDGYIYTVAGKGSFAAPQDGVNRVRRDALLGQFDSSAAELLFLGMTAEELTLRLRDAALRQARREEAGQ